MNDATFVESRRMRTWQEDEPPPEPRRWFLVAKAQAMRYQRNWVFWTIVSLAILLTIGTMVACFASMDDGGGIHVGVIIWGVIPIAAVIVGLAILLAAAPAVADDIRFHAPLYYFSRPLSSRDYLIGKAAFVTGLILLLCLPPVLMVGIVGIGTWGADGPAPPEAPEPGAAFEERSRWYQDRLAAHQRYMPEWRATHMDSFGDWLSTMVILLVGVAASSAFLGALTLVLSAWTTRGWHAAVAIVVAMVGMGAIGGNLGALLTGGAATGLAFSPPAWPYAVTVLPLEWHYQSTTWTDPFLRQAPAGAVLSLVLMAVATVGLYMLAHNRLRRLGGQT